MNGERPLLAALALLSAAVTAQQIALMQVLGWMHWHHFAYMVVAIALLGFGIAGTILSLARAWLLAHRRAWQPWLLLATAASIPLGVRFAQFDSFAVDLPLVFFDPLKNAWRLVALCLLLLPPFLGGGLVTGLILTARVRNAGRFYAASLVGAGLGGLLGLAFVSFIDPPRLPAAVASLALVATFSLWNETSWRARLAALLVTVFLGISWIAPSELRASQFKPIRRTLDLPDARVIAAAPSVHGWVQVVDAPALRPAPAVSFDFAGEIPTQRAVFVNGIGYGSLLDLAAIQAPRWLEFTTDAAAFFVNAPRHVLLLENGPGGWGALAAARGASRVSVVEPNRTLVNLLSAEPNVLAPEWRLPAVNLVVASGRAYLRNTDEAYDVIRFPSAGALGGSAGLASTSEQFLLTREAFAEAWDRLAPQGVIAATAWMDFPERNPLRLLATLVEAAEGAGVSPRQHLVAVRGWASVTFLLRREPWTAEAIASLRRFCAERGFDPLLLPDLRVDERENYHAWQNPEFFKLIDQIVDGPRGPIYQTHPFALRPATDDRPYFSQFLRWEKWDRLAQKVGSRAMPFFELGSLTVAMTLIVLLVLATSGIVLPLLVNGWRTPGKFGVLLYFGGLGAGFMAVEIGLMLRAHAWLGSPVIAAAVVLTALLIASGAGSLWSEKWAAEARPPRRAVAIITGGVLLTSWLLTIFGPIAGAWPFAAQLAFLLFLVVPLGVAMGTAFPLGLRRLETIAPTHVPWAWAINGCISVATPAAAMLLGMSFGFSALFVAAALAYGVAWLGAARL